jgi:hypothetical protein
VVAIIARMRILAWCGCIVMILTLSIASRFSGATLYARLREVRKKAKGALEAAWPVVNARASERCGILGTNGAVISSRGRVEHGENKLRSGHSALPMFLGACAGRGGESVTPVTGISL